MRGYQLVLMNVVSVRKKGKGKFLRRRHGDGGCCSIGGLDLLGLGLLLCRGLLSLCLRGGVLERSDGGGLLDLGWVLVDLGGGLDRGLGLGLEQVTNTGRETTANFDGLGGLLLLSLLLLLLFGGSVLKTSKCKVDKPFLLGPPRWQQGQLQRRPRESRRRSQSQARVQPPCSRQEQQRRRQSRQRVRPPPWERSPQWQGRQGRPDRHDKSETSQGRHDTHLLLLLFLLGGLGSFGLLLTLERGEDLVQETGALGAVLLLCFSVSLKAGVSW